MERTTFEVNAKQRNDEKNVHYHWQFLIPFGTSGTTSEQSTLFVIDFCFKMDLQYRTTQLQGRPLEQILFPPFLSVRYRHPI
jgi:hypothetical protein